MSDLDQLSAFGAVLGSSEGTDAIPGSQGGYKALVGGGTFASYADHPRQRIWLPRYGVYSTAAGRYQFLAATWDGLRQQLNLTDFSPPNQDAGMVQLLKEKGAYALLLAGHFDEAVAAAAKTWASLPGAGYGQREVALDKLRDVFTANGGVLA